MKQIMYFFSTSSFEMNLIIILILIFSFLLFISICFSKHLLVKRKLLNTYLEKHKELKNARFKVVNNNKPLFCFLDYFRKISFSQLDKFGRAGSAFYRITKKTLPSEGRKQISHIHPSGWQSKQYKFINGGNLYNRCHLIGFQLCGENDNPLNLITGTRSFNTQGMLPFEEKVANFVKQTGKPVLYRVTPIYYGNNRIAKGVLMEARSCFDKSICFCVFVYNKQEQININYMNGSSTKKVNQKSNHIQTRNKNNNNLKIKKH